ncbi:hypothetical protein GGR51DRAFT_555149 [Nemania sp. FL0031]|nr:hypothetical protein GGR51DRAFT_555149 [Nemania sp. FL0031]
MTIVPDPYKILGVSKDAQITEIRAAHRKLVLKCHPDKIQDPTLKAEKQIEFQQVQQAYELLSNENEREKYDRKAEQYEYMRERDRAKAAAARAAPSTPRESPLYREYNVKEASPRSTTFKSSPYGRTPPRSWEDTTTRIFEEARRHARKTASYEREKPSKRDDERRSKRKEEEERAREKEARDLKEAKEARKAKERKEEKERLVRELEKERLREAEKEKRREEKKAHSDRDKERAKDRKTATAEKHRSRHTVIEEETSESSDSSDDDVIYEPPPKAERKKSNSGRRPDDIDPPLTSDRTRKLSSTMEGAVQYLTRAGANIPTGSYSGRAKSYAERSMSFTTPMVPTPPPATAGPFTPPAPPVPQVEEPEEMSEEEMIRRSGARPTPRRMSHDTPRSSRDKAPGHKKSSSSRDHQPIIVEAGSPSTRNVPGLSRAHTDAYSRAIPIPTLNRSETYHATTERERERHERSRSRHSPIYADDEDSDDARDRRHRRSRRTKSPEPMSQVRYTVDGGKSMPMRPKQYHDQAPRGSYSKKGAYVVPNSSARLQRAHTTYARGGDYYAEERPQHFSVSGIKYSTQFNERDIAYSDLPYGGASYQSDVYAA